MPTGSCCDRIDASTFDGESSKRYTAKAVSDLVSKPEMRAFARYAYQRDMLFHVALLAPLTLFVCFYCDLVFGLTYGDEPLYQLMGSMVRMTQPMIRLCLRGLMSLYILPCAVLVPFCGLFREVSQEEANLLLAVLLAVLLIVGQMVETIPTQPQDDSIGIVTVIVRGLSSVIAPAGYLVGAYAVRSWRCMFWKRAVYIPEQIVSIPILVGLFGLLWNQYAALCILSLVPSQGSARAQLIETLRNDSSALFHVGTFVAHRNGLRWDEYVAAPEVAAREWGIQFGFAWICIVAAVVGSFVTRALSSIGDAIIPTHPTPLLFHAVALVLVVYSWGAVFTSTLAWWAVSCYLYCLVTVEWSDDY